VIITKHTECSQTTIDVSLPTFEISDSSQNMSSIEVSYCLCINQVTCGILRKCIIITLLHNGCFFIVKIVVSKTKSTIYQLLNTINVFTCIPLLKANHHITRKSGSAKNNVRDDHAFLCKHAIFRHLPNRK
jgi:hypothetical protein